MKVIISVDAPAHWASYLVNGDDTGLDVRDAWAALTWLQKIETENDCRIAAAHPADDGIFEGEFCNLMTYDFLGN